VLGWQLPETGSSNCSAVFGGAFSPGQFRIAGSVPRGVAHEFFQGGDVGALSASAARNEGDIGEGDDESAPGIRLVRIFDHIGDPDSPFHD